jgi:hypothetical protein
VEDGGLPIVEFEAARPEASPVALWLVDSSSVTLGIPELGTVTVSADRIIVRGPDAQAREAAWTRLRGWAIGQHFTAQGYRVLPGCVVARNGRAVALTGSTRSGASVLGLQLTRHGWGLVSDGVAVIDADGICRALHPRATLDRKPAESLFADYPQEKAASGRDRSVVHAPAHADARLSAIVPMQVKDALELLSINLIESRFVEEQEWMAGLVCSIPGSIAAVQMPEVLTIAVRRSNPRNLEELARVAPPALAGQLDAFLRELRL